MKVKSIKKGLRLNCPPTSITVPKKGTKRKYKRNINKKSTLFKQS